MAPARFYYRSPDTPAPNKPLNVGISAIIERDGHVLMDLRADCNRWAMIGGKMDDHESLVDAMVREIREETGLPVASYQLFGTFSDPSRRIAYPDGNIFRLLTVAFRVQVGPGEPRLSEESHGLRWVRKEDLAGLDIVETHRHILDHYLAGAELVVE